MIPKLSIVVPIWNMNGKLKNLTSWMDEALRLNLQVILVEDTSNRMPTTELDELFAIHTDGNLVRVSGEFGNPGSARNAGKELASGEWIAFWDADDVGFPQKALDVLLRADLNCDLIVLSSETRDWSTSNLLAENHVNPHSGNISQVAGRPGIWRMIFNSKFIEKATFPPYRMAEDQVFLAQIVCKNPNIRFYDEITYSYFVNVPGQLTRSTEAIRDLGLAIADMEKIRGKTEVTVFVQELLIRQHISAIRYSPGKPKLKYLFKLLALILGNHCMVNTRLFFKVLVK